MRISYNWLQEFFSQKLPHPEKLAELLMSHAFEVKDIEMVDKDWILDVDILANRAYDCLSHVGIAREISAIMQLKMKNEKLKIQEKEMTSGPLRKYLAVEVRDRKLCPRYSACLFLNVKVGPSPQFARERLEACGVRTINNVVDATNYVALELGQPLHAFDFEKIAKQMSKNNVKQTRNIIVRNAKNGERLHALDDNIYELDESMIVIADGEGPIALGGIIGGLGSGITETTTTVLIEAANFDRASVYKTSKKLGLQTESSMRFSYGLDGGLVPIAQERIAQVLKSWAGAQQVRGMIDRYTLRIPQRSLEFDPPFVRQLLGISLKEKDMILILERLGFSVRKQKGGTYMVIIPSFRNDIAIREDIVEEIGRMVGYDQIPTLPPAVFLVTAAQNSERMWMRLVRNILRSAGWTELYSYSFVSPQSSKVFGYTDREIASLFNPVSSEYSVLRPSLLIKMFETANKNIVQEFPLRLFEIGKIFFRERGVPKEKNMLAAILTHTGDEGAGFSEMKGLLTRIFQECGIADVWYDQAEPLPFHMPLSVWHPKRSAEIKRGNDRIGFFGECSLEVLRKTGFKMRVTACEIDFELFSRIATEEKEYRPIPKYPSLVRDIAVLVPTSELAENVEGVIHAIGKELVYDTDLFDIYEGQGVPEGMKNLAYHIIYQAMDHTLSEGEIDILHKKIEHAMRERGWEVR